MSAFIVGKEHINAILLAGLSVRCKPFTWYYNEEKRQLTSDNADEIGQMLLDENAASVAHRYPNDSLSQLPGKINSEWLLPFTYHPIVNKMPTTIEAIKLIICLAYQSCEHPDWKTSKAKAFCQALKEILVRQLPGYDEAPWEWEDPTWQSHTVTKLVPLG